MRVEVDVINCSQGKEKHRHYRRQNLLQCDFESVRMS